MNNKILFIVPQNSLPCIDGGKIGVFFPMKYFTKYFKVFAAFPVQKYDENIKKQYKDHSITAIPFEFCTKDSPMYYIRSIFSNLSFKMTKYYNQKFYTIIEKTVTENDIQIIWVSAPHMAKYALNLKKKYPYLKIYFREHNIEYDLVKQYSQNAKNKFIKLFSYFEYLKTKKYEQYLWNKFDKVFFISDTDLEEAKKVHTSFDESNLIYDGMEINYDNATDKVEENSFIFTASLGTFQNRVNLKYFIEKIWVPFVKKYPECKLYLTGNSDEKVQRVLNMTAEKLEQLNIINLGFVDNIQKTISQKQYVVSPTIAGSGIRLKVLESCALGKTTFVSKIDYQMCKHFKDMDNIVLFENKNDFTKKYEQLSLDLELQKHIQSNAKNIAKQVFSWGNYTKKAVDYIGTQK